MNNFYVLIYLTKALNNKCIQQEFKFSYSPHKDVWEGYFQDGEHKNRIVFSTHPSETALFPDKYRAPKKANVTTFFPELAGKKISEITIAENDRFITFSFDSDHKLLFQIFGNKPNVFLIKDEKIIEAFKGSDSLIGTKPPEPRPPSPPKDLPEGLSPKRTITKVNPKFPRHLIPYIIDHYSLDEKLTGEIKKVVETLTESMLESPEFRVLEDGNLCLVPEKLLPADSQKTFDDITSAIRYVYYDTSKERRLSSRLISVKPKIEKAINKSESIIKQLQNADKGLERAEKYEQYGHILMAHAHEKVDTGTELIELPDLYNSGENIKIELKPTLNIAENAQRYYNKSTKAVRNVEESEKRLKREKIELQKLKEVQSSLAKVEKIYEFDDWYKDHHEELKELGILSAGNSQKTLPYRQVKIDGYEIWIGKNAKSNDKLTSAAHKEDVWLHARGVGGSHVVIRMNNNKEMPPKMIILKAASLAAWNSKARGSNLAPVIVTKRKHVSNPKGAPAGTVRVHKEDVVMVKPRKIT